MVEVISADKVTLFELEKNFGLQQINDNQFFLEWQLSLPELTDVEKQRLERVKAVYSNLARRSVLENTIKMAIVSPLLDLAGFFLPPFYVNSEEEVRITAEDANVVVRGRIDVLVLKEQFWVLVIESKRAEFSLKVGIPQVLAYMLATPQPTQPLYGMVTNGSNFVFLKMIREDTPCFMRSQEFILERGHDIYTVLQVLKQLAEVIRK
jgi:predicted type IV restriction endonuclease